MCEKTSREYRISLPCKNSYCGHYINWPGAGTLHGHHRYDIGAYGRHRHIMMYIFRTLSFLDVFLMRIRNKNKDAFQGSRNMIKEGSWIWLCAIGVKKNKRNEISCMVHQLLLCLGVGFTSCVETCDEADLQYCRGLKNSISVGNLAEDLRNGAVPQKPCLTCNSNKNACGRIPVLEIFKYQILEYESNIWTIFEVLNICTALIEIFWRQHFNATLTSDSHANYPFGRLKPP